METNKNRMTRLNFICRSLNSLNVEFHRKKLTQPQGIFMIFKTLNLEHRNSMTKHSSCYIKQKLRGLFASITNSCNQLLPLPKLLHYGTKFRVSVGVQARRTRPAGEGTGKQIRMLQDLVLLYHSSTPLSWYLFCAHPQTENAFSPYKTTFALSVKHHASE